MTEWGKSNGQQGSESSPAALQKSHPPRLRELDNARLGRQSFDAGNDGAGPAEGDDIGVVEGRDQFRPSRIRGLRQLCDANRPTQVGVVEHEAHELAKHGRLPLEFGIRQLAAKSTRADDREADVHGRLDARARLQCAVVAKRRYGAGRMWVSPATGALSRLTRHVTVTNLEPSDSRHARKR